jgi:hypothetical protein
MAKEFNFSGIQPDAIGEIVILVQGRTAPPPATGNGLTDTTAINLLLAVVSAQTAALNPGKGLLGFMDAYKGFDDVNIALDKVKNAGPAAINNDANSLITPIKKLTVLFANGPITDGFFTAKP